MKTFKKNILGLGIAVLLLSWALLPIARVSAATVSPDDLRNTLYWIAVFDNQKPKSINATINGVTYLFQDSNTSDDNINLKLPSVPTGIFCTQGDSSAGTGGGALGGITITGAAAPIPGGGYSYPATLNFGVKKNDSGNCNFTNVQNVTLSIGVVYSVPGTPPPTGTVPPPPGGGTTDPNDPAQAGETCEAKWSNPLTWIVCPVFNIAAETSNALIGLFKDQLCFKVDTSPTSAAATCNGKVTDTSSIKPAWSAIKNIVSALLVVIMLIAIFAQATSIGPIDTYTIRKMLPRLVAAVILIQLSFYMFSWVINVVDDIGEGLNSLLNSIFPGNIDNLNVLLGRANIGDGTAGAVNWLLIAGGVAAAIVAFPTVLMMLFLAIVAILVGLAVLIFRKVLIVALLLIAPVALLLWVLPNTERYWKMWWDNFLKVLLMFPIIVLLIEAGRIFAYVAGPATGGGLIGLFVILVGFFGPLLILPKTYRWGGSMMQAAGNAVQGAAKPASSRTGASIKEYGQRRQGEWAKQYNPAAGSFSRGLRRLQSGHVLPTERSRRLTIAAGDRWASERSDEANAMVGRVYEKALAEGYEMTDENGQVKRLTGVAAGKQALMDIAGTEKTDDASVRSAQSAVKQLIDTSSWIELQSGTVSRGSNAGKRVAELGDIWNKTLETSPQHYGAVAGRRPDFAPHMLESYEKKYEAGTYGEVGTQQAAQKRDAARVAQAIGQLKGSDLQSVDQRFYQEVERLGGQEVEVERTAEDGTKHTERVALSQVFGDHLQTIASTPGAGQYNVSQLNGGDLGAQVNRALAAGNYGRDLGQIIQGTRAAPPSAAASAAPTEGAEIRVDHGEHPRTPTQPPSTGGATSWTGGPEVPQQPPEGGVGLNIPPREGMSTPPRPAGEGWRFVPEGEVIPSGMEIRTDMSGRHQKGSWIRPVE